MGEAIYEKLEKVATLLHWIGKYDEANAISLTIRLMRHKATRELAEWQAFVEGIE